MSRNERRLTTRLFLAGFTSEIFTRNFWPTYCSMFWTKPKSIWLAGMNPRRLLMLTSSPPLFVLVTTQSTIWPSATLDQSP